jgi:predicted hotdog family 3-hydroxylacyl-ACP dehydratase
MEPSEYKITDLIPQRPPMVMIDQLIYAGERSARGKLLIKESNLFCRNSVFQEAGIVEFIAQTAAAYTGYLQLKAGKEISLGFIGSVKNLVINSLPAVNTAIESEIIVENELLGFTIITGRILQNNRILAECEMRIKI